MDCFTDNKIFNSLKPQSPFQDNSDAYEVIASCSRPFNETSPKAMEKVAPPRARSSVDVSGKGDDTPPDTPARNLAAITMEDRCQQSLSRLSGEYEEIIFTSRKRVLGKSSFYGNEEYSPKAFLDQFSKHLPRLVKITKGYYGEEQIETFEIGQVLFIRKTGSQERVVASVLQGPRSLAHRLLSIPLDYNAHFRFVSDKREKEKLGLRKVLSKHRLPVDVIFIPELTSNDMHLSSPSRLMSNDDRLVLRLTHRFQESFLLGHTLCKDKVTSIIQQLPLFLSDLRLSLVIGRVGYGTQEWESYLDALDKICTHQINCDNYVGNPDIALYDIDENNFDATVQVPRVYCTIQDCLSDTSMYQTLGASGTKSTPAADNCNTYEVIPAYSKDKESFTKQKKPFVLPKPQKKTDLRRAKSSVEVSNTGIDANRAAHKKNKCQSTLPNVSNEYEDISLVSRDNLISGNDQLEKTSVSSKTDNVEEFAPPRPPKKIDHRGKCVERKVLHTEVKSKIEEMTIHDVGIALQKLRLEKYIPVFQSQWIDGAILRGLNADILHLECGMKKVEAVRLMTFVQKGHIPE